MREISSSLVSVSMYSEFGTPSPLMASVLSVTSVLEPDVYSRVRPVELTHRQT